MGEILKLIKYLTLISAILFSQVAFGQTWTWKYISYLNGQRSYEGSVELSAKSNAFVMKFIVPNMNRCWQGELDAVPLIEDKVLIITLNPPISGCQKVRFVLNTDGSGGDREFLANNEWKKEDVDRGLSSLSTKDLVALYQKLKLSGAEGGGSNLNANLIAANNKTSASVTVPAPVPGPGPGSVPVPVPATLNAPARAAAIANVQVATQAAVGQSIPGQPTQLTANPIDLQKKTSSNDVWVSFNPSITVQERQFCRIIENFRTENAIAQQSRNQIKVNETFRNLSQSLNSLLPDGKFQGWIMRTVYVSQASDGSAEVLMELPCTVYVGSNACDANPQNFYGTAPEGSRIYTELAKMTVGDFALTSGQFVYVDDKAYDKNRSVASFRFLKTASHCRAKEMPADSDFFGLKLDVISTIK
jgi:hypothetical protein